MFSSVFAAIYLGTVTSIMVGADTNWPANLPVWVCFGLIGMLPITAFFYSNKKIINHYIATPDSELISEILLGKRERKE